MTKKLLLLCFMTSSAFATGQKYGPSYDSTKTNLEFQNTYQNIRNPIIGYGSASSFTVTQLTVSSMTVSSFTATSISAKGLNMNGNKITGLANGTASTDAAAFGQIHLMQAPVQATVTTSSSALTAAGNYVSSNLIASITPTSSSSKVKISASFTAKIAAGNADAGRFTIFRGASNVAPTAGMVTLQVTSAVNQLVPCTLNFVDSPATTSATTYTVKFSNVNGVTTVGVGSDFSGDQESIILEEVQ